MSDESTVGEQHLPYDGVCPECRREYHAVLSFTNTGGVIRGNITGDVCITPDEIFTHGELEIAEQKTGIPMANSAVECVRADYPLEEDRQPVIRIPKEADDDAE